MKKIYIVLLILIALVANTSSQPYGWFNLSNGNMNNLNCIRALCYGLELVYLK